MENDLDIIRQLENQIGKKLEQKTLGRITRFDSQGYVLDGDNFVIGLNLYSCKIADLIFLSKLFRLTHLQLGKNKISDVSQLQGLTALKTLRLSSKKLARSGIKNVSLLGLLQDKIKS